jgi:UDP-3-O-[3-hydroxymyristoyl] glucosamine N-acyltransferase
LAVSLGELATRFGCELQGDPTVMVERVATLLNASAGSISFLSNPLYREQLAACQASAVIVKADVADACSGNALIAADPYLCFARIAAVLHPPPEFAAGIHPTAVVAESARVAANAHIGPLVCIGENCDIGERAVINAGSVLEFGVRIGADTRVLPKVTIMHDVVIGERCLLHPGSVIGADGFGNAMSREGWVKVPQVGSVIIGDDVEIGANTTVDRGTIDDTVIENGVRLDNLIQIGHNVRIGEHSALASMVGIAGSATIGKRCMLAGMSGLVGHITLCDDVVIGGATMVTKSISEPGMYVASFPAEPEREWKRQVARFRRMDDLAKRVRRIEKGSTDNEQ